MTQELRDKVVREDPFILKYCHNKYKAQEMCDRVVDPSLLALKFVPDWFVTNKMIKKLDSTVFSDNYLVFGDSDSGFFTFFNKDISFNIKSFDNINLYDSYFSYCDRKTINHARLMTWYNKYKQCKASKK